MASITRKMIDEAHRMADEPKLRYELTPPLGYMEMIKCLTVGSQKHGAFSWRKGSRWSETLGALMRHLWAFIRGESYDKDGFHHLGAVMVRAAQLIEYDKLSLGYDDRLTDDPPRYCPRCGGGAPMSSHGICEKCMGTIDDKHSGG